MTDAINLRIPELFVRLQSLRDLCWKAHVGKRDAAALEYADEMAKAAMELLTILERKA